VERWSELIVLTEKMLDHETKRLGINRKVWALIRHHSDRRAALWGSDSLNVALSVNGFAVFISRQIGAQVYWLAANNTGYIWEGAAFHKRLLLVSIPA
jgi:hypothetical protein